MPDATAELERAAADIPLNRDARDVLTRATALASDRGGVQAGPVDVLNAILSLRGCSAYEAIRALGVDPQTIAAQPDGTSAQAANKESAATLPLRQLLSYRFASTSSATRSSHTSVVTARSRPPVTWT